MGTSRDRPPNHLDPLASQGWGLWRGLPATGDTVSGIPRRYHAEAFIRNGSASPEGLHRLIAHVKEGQPRGFG